MIQRIRRVPLDWVSPDNVAAYAAGDVSGLRVLDFGCGAGVLLDRLGPARLRVGVDVAWSALEQTRARCGADINLVRIGIRGPLPFPSATFDLVTTTEVIEHVPNEREMLAEISRVLKPGGRLVLTTPHQHWLSALDVGNLKFRFPDLHAFYWRTVRGMSASAFAERYGFPAPAIDTMGAGMAAMTLSLLPFVAHGFDPNADDLPVQSMPVLKIRETDAQRAASVDRISQWLFPLFYLGIIVSIALRY